MKQQVSIAFSRQRKKAGIIPEPLSNDYPTGAEALKHARLDFTLNFFFMLMLEISIDFLPNNFIANLFEDFLSPQLEIKDYYNQNHVTLRSRILWLRSIGI